MKHIPTCKKNLYTSSRREVEQNSVYLEQNRDKIRKINGQYYAPFDLTIKVKFGDEKPQTLQLN